MSDGKKGMAPCGHAGTHVVGNYVECDLHCDRSGVPTAVKPETTIPITRRCPGCASTDVEPFPIAAWHFTGALQAWHCVDCGKVW